MESPLQAHWSVAKCVLRYLAGTANHGAMIGEVWVEKMVKKGEPSTCTVIAAISGVGTLSQGGLQVPML